MRDIEENLKADETLIRTARHGCIAAFTERGLSHLPYEDIVTPTGTGELEFELIRCLTFIADIGLPQQEAMVIEIETGRVLALIESMTMRSIASRVEVFNSRPVTKKDKDFADNVRAICGRLSTIPDFDTECQAAYRAVFIELGFITQEMATDESTTLAALLTNKTGSVVNPIGYRAPRATAGSPWISGPLFDVPLALGDAARKKEKEAREGRERIV